jgi:hypothetical protein
MDKSPTPSERPVSDRLHRNVYMAMMALAAWLVVSISGFFSDRGYTGFALAVASAFIVIAVGLPYELWRLASRSHHSPESTDDPSSWRNWISGEFETLNDRPKAAQATLEILLPIAAVVFGMTVFAVVHYFDVGTGV